jgi:hypothetical protein
MPLLSQTTYVKFGATFDSSGGGSITVAEVVSWSFVPATRNEIVAPDLTTTTRASSPATVELGTLELEINVTANVKAPTTDLWSDYQGQLLPYAIAVTCPDNIAAQRYQEFSFYGIMRDTAREATVDTQLTQTLAIRVRTPVSVKYLETLILS